MLSIHHIYLLFSEHIQGARFIAPKHDSEAENEAGPAETQSDTPGTVTNSRLIEK